ncbi:MAG TPA: methyl-accepting chemotaxis protein [Thermotogota bacterium]|nr:methyl-accepting chemotaxis protein [Thermotogota bacterium]
MPQNRENASAMSSNKVVLAINWFLDLFLIGGYIVEYFKGTRSLLFVGSFVLIVLVPILLATALFIRDKKSQSMKYITLAGYFILYVVAMFTSPRILIYVYFFPIISMYLLYYNLKLIVYSCIGIAAINIARIVWQVLFLKMTSLELSTDFTIQFASVFLYGFSIIVTTRLSNKFNSEKIASIEEEKQKQEQILKNVLQLSSTVEQNAKNVSDIIEKLHHSTADLSEGVLKVEETSDHTFESVQNQSELIKSIQTVIEKTSRSSEHMGELSHQTLEMTREGLKHVKGLSANVQQVNSESEGVYHTMKDLARNCAEIQDITQIIRGISDQTNLLSLNASIESARAGEAGKGFAVVAEEIRKLAMQSKTSAEDIGQIIKELINKAEQSVKAFDKLNSSFNDQNLIISGTQDIFTKIIEQTNTLDRLVEEVAERVNEISAYNANIVKNIEDISVDCEHTQNIVKKTAEVTQYHRLETSEALKYTDELKTSSLEFEKYTNG